VPCGVHRPPRPIRYKGMPGRVKRSGVKTGITPAVCMHFDCSLFHSAPLYNLLHNPAPPEHVHFPQKKIATRYTSPCTRGCQRVARATMLVLTTDSDSEYPSHHSHNRGSWWLGRLATTGSLNPIAFLKNTRLCSPSCMRPTVARHVHPHGTRLLLRDPRRPLISLLLRLDGLSPALGHLRLVFSSHVLSLFVVICHIAPHLKRTATRQRRQGKAGIKSPARRGAGKT